MERQGIVLVAIAALAATAGCTGLLLGDGLQEEAEPARVGDAALQDSSFTLEQTDTLEIDRNVSAAGQERRIQATNHAAVYTRNASSPVGDVQLAGFVVVSTPAFEVAGQAVNPIASMSNEELVERFQSQLESQTGGDVRDVRIVDHRTETVLGSNTNVTTFAAETTRQGQEITLDVHVTKVRHQDDVVVAIGAHPEALEHVSSEISELMRGVEHPAES